MKQGSTGGRKELTGEDRDGEAKEVIRRREKKKKKTRAQEEK